MSALNVPWKFRSLLLPLVTKFQSCSGNINFVVLLAKNHRENILKRPQIYMYVFLSRTSLCQRLSPTIAVSNMMICGVTHIMTAQWRDALLPSHAWWSLEWHTSWQLSEEMLCCCLMHDDLWSDTHHDSSVKRCSVAVSCMMICGVTHIMTAQWRDALLLSHAWWSVEWHTSWQLSE